MKRLVFLVIICHFTINVVAQKVKVFLNPHDCISCVSNVNLFNEIMSLSELEVITTESNEVLLKEFANVHQLPFSANIKINDSLFKQEMKKYGNKSHLQVIFNNKIIGRFYLKTLKNREKQLRLTSVLEGLHHPIFHVRLKWPIYYPRVTSQGFYHINGALIRLDYYSEYDRDSIICTSIRFSTIEQHIIRGRFDKDSASNILNWIKERRSFQPGWGLLKLGRGNIYDDTLLSSFTMLCPLDSTYSSLHYLFGHVKFHSGKLVELKIKFEKDLYNIDVWPYSRSTMKIGDKIVFFKQDERENASTVNKLSNLGYINQQNKINSFPIVFDTITYPNYRCGPNFRANYYQSGDYIYNQVGFHHLYNTKEQKFENLNWGDEFSQFNKYSLAFCDRCSSLGFVNRQDDFYFIVIYSKNNRRQYFFLRKINKETRFDRILFDEDIHFASFFQKELIMCFNGKKLRWEPYTIF